MAAPCGWLPRMLGLQRQECGVCAAWSPTTYTRYMCELYMGSDPSVACICLHAFIVAPPAATTTWLRRRDGEPLFVFNYVWTRCHFCAGQDLLMCVPSLPSSQKLATKWSGALSSFGSTLSTLGTLLCLNLNKQSKCMLKQYISA